MVRGEVWINDVRFEIEPPIFDDLPIVRTARLYQEFKLIDVTRDALEAVFAEAERAALAKNEHRIRSLLEGWISELEPSVCYLYGCVVGLAGPDGTMCLGLDRFGKAQRVEGLSDGVFI